MLYSMTGYGKDDCQYNDKKIIIEIRSLNSKQLDLNTRMPGYYKEKDLEIRNLISERLIRGKVDFTLFVDSSESENAMKINERVLVDYYNQLKAIGESNSISDDSSWFSVLTRLPEVLRTERAELEKQEWEAVLPCIQSALDRIISYREQEGMALETDITKRIYSISNLISEIEVFEEDRIKHIKEKIESGLREIAGDSNYDNNRLEQELIYYIEKLDINEEKVRLSNHCNYFIDNIKADEAVGKKLGFISQELGREINTIGSKANNADIQRIVVQMKDDLEKIKEQLMNVL